MDFVVTWFAGDQLDAVAEVTGDDRAPNLVLLPDGGAWSAVSGGWSPTRKSVSTTIVTTKARDISVAAADLRRIEPTADGVRRLLAEIDDQDCDVVALRDDDSWSRTTEAALIEGLQRAGRRVLFFTDTSAALGDLASVDTGITVVAGAGGATVVGRPPSVADAEQPMRIEIDARKLRISHIVDRAIGPPDIVVDRPPGSASRQLWNDRTGDGWEAIGIELDTEPARPREDEVRSVNTMVVPRGGEQSVDTARPLRPGDPYDLLVNIGPHDAASLLSEPDGRWPQEHLPDGGLRLRAVLRLDGVAAPVTATFTLPDSGPSFACDCTGQADDHEEDCARRPWVRFPITAPAAPVVWTGELVVYFEVVAVHVQQLVLPVGEPGGVPGAAPGNDGPHARRLYVLDRSFANLGALRDRTASVLVTDGGSRALVNGLSFADNPVSISANAADVTVRGARQALYDMHLETVADGSVSRFDAEYRKPAAQFRADLTVLARQGAVIYERLFRDNPVFDTLPELIRHEAAARGRPAVLTVADPSVGDPDRQHPVPWALVYDLPIGLDPGKEPAMCPSVERFGPGGTATEVPAHCPETHDEDTLCPFGFWGLSSVIEQPPGSERLVSHVFDDEVPVSVAMAVDPNLDPTLTERHLTALRSILPAGTLTDHTVDEARELAAALAGETMDVAYLYCHSGYYQQASNVLPLPTLQFGRSMVHPVEVSNWRRGTAWPRPHWPRRKPLVVLNGCHTTELTTATLSNFVDAFANRAGAAGVLGTEVTVEQGMASWVLEMLLRRLVDGEDVGQALRAVRWQLIARGNVMGLAYTPYCVAGLRMRPAARSAAAVPPDNRTEKS